MENFVSQLLLASYGVIIAISLQYYIIQPIIAIILAIRQLASQLYIKLCYSKVEEFLVNCQQASYIHPTTVILLSIRVASHAQPITTGSCNNGSYMNQMLSVHSRNYGVCCLLSKPKLPQHGPIAERQEGQYIYFFNKVFFISFSMKYVQIM